MTNTTGQERALRDALEAVLNTSGARGEYHSLKYTDAVAEAEKLLADPVSPLDASEAECVREAAAQVMENLAFFTPVEELLHMTKQEMSVRTCREGAKAIRAMPLPHQPATDEGERVRVLDGANSHVFDKRLVIGDGDAFQKGDGGECIAFADEPWASRIATALSTRTSQPPAAETRLRSVLSYIRSELALFAACCAVSNKTSDTFVGTEAKAKEWVACINDALAQSPVETLSARDLFEIARPCFHYAKRGTPDGGMFERSETGRLLMNAMEKIAALTQPEPTAQQATPASRILNSLEEANAWVRGEDTGATVHHVAAQQAAGEAVAWMYTNPNFAPGRPPNEVCFDRHEVIGENWTETPLYATPQPTETQRIVAWQPIETAPKDWTDVLVYSPEHESWNCEGVFMAFYDAEIGAWLSHQPGGNIVLEPTKWMPRPEAPASGEHLAGDKA